MDERRKHCRYAFLIRVRVLAAGAETIGTMLDISAEGAQIVAAITATPGSVAFLRFSVNGREAEAIGSVARIDDHGGAPCLGLHLHAGNEAYVDLIERLDALPEAARALELSALRDVMLQVG